MTPKPPLSATSTQPDRRVSIATFWSIPTAYSEQNDPTDSRTGLNAEEADFVTIALRYVYRPEENDAIPPPCRADSQHHRCSSPGVAQLHETPRVGTVRASMCYRL
jgi:hypothetical protein